MRLLLHLVVLAAPLFSQKEIPYSSPGGQPLVLDFYTPAVRPPFPAAILVHGGDFTTGTARNPTVLRLAGLLRAAGVAVFSINYRLAPNHPFPAAVEDVAQAAQWVRAHTREYQLDPRRIALIGVSSGAYLVNMAAARGAPVAAAISIAGWSDFRNQPLRPNLRAFLGRASIAEASPAMHLTGNEPPFLLLHGDRDEAVPLEQSVHFQGALQSAGVSCQMIIIQGGGHDPLTWETLPSPRPWEREMLLWLQRAFARR